MASRSYPFAQCSGAVFLKKVIDSHLGIWCAQACYIQWWEPIGVFSLRELVLTEASHVFSCAPIKRVGVSSRKVTFSVFTLAPINHGTNLRCYVMMNCWVSYSTSWERKQMQKVGFPESHINVDKSSQKSTPERLADSSSPFYLRKDTAIDSQTRSTDETKTVSRLLWYHHADSVCAIH